MVSIADIVGYEYIKTTYIAYSLDSFFNSKGDGYHMRSVGLLRYTADNAMDKIDFEYEPIVVDEMDTNKYVISRNGLHRYSVLKILYLNEYMHYVGNNDKIDELRKKYTFPVDVAGVDFFKTYSKFLLMIYPCGIKDIEQEWDYSNYKYSGRLRVIKNDGSQVILETDQDLLSYVKSHSVISRNIGSAQWYYNHYPSFRHFLEEYYSDFIDIHILQKRFNEYQNNKGGMELC